MKETVETPSIHSKAGLHINPLTKPQNAITLQHPIHPILNNPGTNIVFITRIRHQHQSRDFDRFNERRHKGHQPRATDQTHKIVGLRDTNSFFDGDGVVAATDIGGRIADGAEVVAEEDGIC